MGGARRCKWNERQDWGASRCLRASHKALPWLVPPQREQDLLPLSNNSQRRLPNVSSIRLKKNRYKELLRAMTCDAVSQCELLPPANLRRQWLHRSRNPPYFVKPTELAFARQAIRG